METASLIQEPSEGEASREILWPPRVSLRGGTYSSCDVVRPPFLPFRWHPIFSRSPLASISKDQVIPRIEEVPVGLVLQVYSELSSVFRDPSLSSVHLGGAEPASVADLMRGSAKFSCLFLNRPIDLESVPKAKFLLGEALVDLIGLPRESSVEGETGSEFAEPPVLFDDLFSDSSDLPPEPISVTPKTESDEQRIFRLTRLLLERGAGGGGGGGRGGSDSESSSEEYGGLEGGKVEVPVEGPDSDRELLTKLLPSLRHGEGHPDSTVPQDKLEALLAALRSNPALERVLEAIGRLGTKAWSGVARVPSAAREDVLDLELGSDISRFLVSEISRFANPVLRGRAWLDYLQSRILQYQFEGFESRKNGPIYAAIDLSGSMEDPSVLPGLRRDVLAVGLILAISKICDVQKRRLHVIGFSDQIIWSKEVKTPTQAVEFATFLMSRLACGGGTNYDLPLEYLSSLSVRSAASGGDLLMITDGEAPVSTSTRKKIESARSKAGVRLFSLLLAEFESSPLLQISDHVVPLQEWADLEQLADTLATTSGSARPASPLEGIESSESDQPPLPAIPLPENLPKNYGDYLPRFVAGSRFSPGAGSLFFTHRPIKRRP